MTITELFVCVLIIAVLLVTIICGISAAMMSADDLVSVNQFRNQWISNASETPQGVFGGPLTPGAINRDPIPMYTPPWYWSLDPTGE